MAIALLIILVAIIAILAVACSTLAMRASIYRRVIRTKNRERDDIIARAVRAETDFIYLKETILTMLGRPVIATLRDDQLKIIADSITAAALGSIPGQRFKN